MISVWSEDDGWFLWNQGLQGKSEKMTQVDLISRRLTRCLEERKQSLSRKIKRWRFEEWIVGVVVVFLFGVQDVTVNVAKQAGYVYSLL